MQGYVLCTLYVERYMHYLGVYAPFRKVLSRMVCIKYNSNHTDVYSTNYKITYTTNLYE